MKMVRDGKLLKKEFLMNGNNKWYLQIIIIINIITFCYSVDKADISRQKSKIRSKGILNFIEPGMNRDLFREQCLKNKWQIVPGTNSIGMVEDSVLINGKMVKANFNIRKQCWNNGDDYYLFVEFRKCGKEYILFKYCLTELKSAKDTNWIFNYIDCFENADNENKAVFTSDCEPSDNETERQKWFDSLINTILSK